MWPNFRKGVNLGTENISFSPCLVSASFSKYALRAGLTPAFL